jgi:hypothetical protein
LPAARLAEFRRMLLRLAEGREDRTMTQADITLALEQEL